MGRIFHGEGSFQEMNFLVENKICLYVSLSLYRFNFTRGDVKGNCMG